MTRRKWTHEEVANLWRIAGTKSISSVAKELNRSIRSIRSKALREGINLSGGTYTIDQVAVMLQCSHKGIMGIIKKLGIRLRRRYQGRKSWVMLSDDQVSRIEEEHNRPFWSRRASECRNCGRTNRRHQSNGYCCRCATRIAEISDEDKAWPVRLQFFLNQIMDGLEGGKIEYGMVEVKSDSVRATIDGQDYVFDFETKISQTKKSG